MKNYISTKSSRLLDVFIIAIIAGIVFGLMRLQESYFLETALFDKFKAYSSLLNTSFIDLKATIIFSVLLIPFIFFTKRIKLIASIFFLFVIISNSMLIQYFLTNFDLLGDEVLKFSLSEMLFIVNTEKTSLHAFEFILFFVYPIIFVLLVYIFSKKKHLLGRNSKIAMLLIYVIFLFASAVDYKYYLPRFSNFGSYQNFIINNNKISYFVSEIVSSKRNENRKISVENIEQSIDNYQSINSQFDYIDKVYPLMHQEEYSNVLGPFFEKSDLKPNIVFVLVESLSRSFSGPNAHLGTFTPFIDSLKTKSLYWTNFLSNAERTYGVLPNVLSSAPYFKQFVSNKNYSNHSSIITELKDQGYYTDFHYGGWEGFSSRGRFVRESKIDDLYADKSFDTLKFKKYQSTADVHHWGYDDKALFEQYFMHTNKIKEPYLSILLTLSMHSPYDVNPDYSLEDAKKYLGTELSDYQKKLLDIHPDKIMSIAFTDQYLKQFFIDFKKRDDFKNTIFVLLGDHNIHSLPLKNELDLFHVPMLIYSDLLTTTRTMNAVSTHREISPSLLGLLENNFDMNFSKEKHWLGMELDTSINFKSDIISPMCLISSKYVNYLYEDNIVLKDEVYQFDSLMNISKQTDEEISKKVMNLYKDYSAIEEYMMDFNRLYKK